MFFVISGFLIGGILQRDIAENRFSLAEFYRKRVRRIFPALFAMIFLCLGFGTIVLSPDRLMELARNAISATLFVSNLDFYRYSGYFDTQAELRPLLHTWSLAVEEQFYLLFPIVLWFVMKRGARHLPLITFLVILAFLALSQWSLKYPTAAYFLTPFRGFELLIGAFVAYAPVPSVRVRLGMAMLGAGLVLLSMLIITSARPFPGLWAAVPTLGTGLILWAGREGQNSISRFLSHPVLLFFGAISYSLYLWHWPIMSYLRLMFLHEPEVWVMGLALAGSVLMGWLSYRYVEKPFAQTSTARPILKVGGVSMMVVIGLCGALMIGNGIPQRFSNAEIQLFDGTNDYSPWRKECHKNLPYDATCTLGQTDDTPARTAVWGDSHGTELAAALSQEYPVRQITASACPPVLGVDFKKRPKCRAANDAMLTGLLQDPYITTVILTTNREAYPQDLTGMTNGYREAVEQLVAGGKDVILLGQIPNPNLDVPQFAGLRKFLGLDLTKMTMPAHSEKPALVAWKNSQEQISQELNVQLIDPSIALCKDEICQMTEEGRVLYFNPTHVSMAGAAKIAQLIERYRDKS